MRSQLLLQAGVWVHSVIVVLVPVREVDPDVEYLVLQLSTGLTRLLQVTSGRLLGKVLRIDGLNQWIRVLLDACFDHD